MLGSERTISVPEQHAAGHGQVGLSIPVPIPNGDLCRFRCRDKIFGGSEGPIPVPEEYGYAAGAGGRREVQPSVTIQIS